MDLVIEKHIPPVCKERQANQISELVCKEAEDGGMTILIKNEKYCFPNYSEPAYHLISLVYNPTASGTATGISQSYQVNFPGVGK